MSVNEKTIIKVNLSTYDNDSPSFGIKYFVKNPKDRKLLNNKNGLFNSITNADVNVFSRIKISKKINRINIGKLSTDHKPIYKTTIKNGFEIDSLSRFIQTLMIFFITPVFDLFCSLTSRLARRLLADHFFVLIVPSDPEPDLTIMCFNC
ncbi:hypothetical protein G3480_24940 [Thiorhodococcus mannitoliphagus]|uniref:Uncharacterized protein n=1 Tax=Thiorhodococcus mannitoliphagus TaxID=329406 RepID=A0A6P1E2B7_9GAMM|nr:hypothetical protein [Thiorhodococcus mannitoliphagus]NEX23491.1 hypothetical protein [Thiorhodococcus mannitoliphagus]